MKSELQTIIEKLRQDLKEAKKESADKKVNK